jgi:aminomethyltransferase
MTDARDALRRTPLDAEHRALGAHMGPFAGWSMPIEYEGTLAEHKAVREAVGLFDLTHLGKILLEGPAAGSLAQRVFTNDLTRVAVGGAQYNMLLNDRGGIVDDLIVYRIAEDRFLVVPNAANTAKVLAALREHEGEGVEATLREDLALIAPQGPRSPDVVSGVFPDAAGLEYMQSAELTYRGTPMVVSRSGYTGEKGFELFVPEDLAVRLWHELLERGGPLGVAPSGLGARDTLRLEMGYPLHGNDIDEDRSPLEAGAGWAVALDKGTFPGREALVRQKTDGIPARLCGLRMRDRLIPRPHYPVFVGDDQVGETTSGTFSPTLRVGIALAYVRPRDLVQAGDEATVDVRGRRGVAEIVKPPFVQASPR